MRKQICALPCNGKARQVDMLVEGELGDVHQVQESFPWRTNDTQRKLLVKKGGLWAVDQLLFTNMFVGMICEHSHAHVKCIPHAHLMHTTCTPHAHKCTPKFNAHRMHTTCTQMHTKDSTQAHKCTPHGHMHTVESAAEM